MKTSAIVALSLVAGAQGFAPVSQGRVGTQLSESLFDKVFGMDLFAPVKDQNNYGARAKKNLKLGEIKEGSSYVPAGLSAKQYAELRQKEAKKKQENYERNVKKAGVFIDYTEWYKKRGTDLSQNWKKDKNLGHTMAKTKYDWSGLTDKKQYAGTKK
ncbi:hypothetical protein IV203_015736 [Nitzschia inconspicua]|uniref:Uncharacterized protein n=1 Tax=Nitzschia inconspicua TaxID=303405 RepID=A0A9K3LBT2_9STRA|nr:hypothetical protein IV203_015736 [Nitzschia inconspicua]